MPKPKEVWQRGKNRFVIFCVTNESSPFPKKNPVTIVYQSIDGTFWSMPVAEFEKAHRLVHSVN